MNETADADHPLTVNDVQSRLNETTVARVVRPSTVAEVQEAVRRARADGLSICVAGARHSMGGQQFLANGVLVDMTGMAQILDLDDERGVVHAQAGIEWAALVPDLIDLQQGRSRQWGIIQKQTGADRLTLGGALGSNVHGRGLTLRPIIADVEWFDIVGPDGELRRVTRDDDPELFRLAIGGYGLFGIMTSVGLRLAPRRKVQRIVELIDVDQLAEAFDDRIRDGYLYGDCQFSIDPAADDFLRIGIFSCYRPVDPETPIPPGQRALTTEDWGKLLYLTHADKARAGAAYTAHYLATSGQIYWSDLHQMSDYVAGYHRRLDQVLGARVEGSEIITEIYVPRPSLAAFMSKVRDDFRANDVDLAYGTIRLTERDDESVMAWARDRYACVIFNLHTPHDPEGIAGSAAAFGRLIDLAISFGGSYYLTYHRFATPAQLQACYPDARSFLARKLVRDPEERFQSDWYRHYRDGLSA